MNPNLFVYGSLLARAGHPMGERLAREAHPIGEAYLQGRLYRVSWYPGLVEGTASRERVYGEVYALNDPVRALLWLDAYEGVAEGGAPGGDYARAERTARLASGEEVRVWVYLYRGAVSGLTIVPGGRWLATATTGACNPPSPRQNS
jgi:gamma-glutamylcyclotransferase (GGCT)/AIG2-like uncharacterized protein YtfP